MSFNPEDEFQYCRHCGSKMPIGSPICPNCGRSQSAQQLQVEGEERKGFVTRNMRTIRVSAFLACMGILIAGLLLGTQAPLSIEEARLIIGRIRRTIISGSLAFQIAVNNIMICLTFFLPILGVLFMALASYSTGVGISALTLFAASTTRIEILQTLFLAPSTWIEFVAYSLAASEGMMLLLSIFTRRFREEGKKLAITVLACVTLLIAGAVVETVLITMR